MRYIVAFIIIAATVVGLFVVYESLQDGEIDTKKIVNIQGEDQKKTDLKQADEKKAETKKAKKAETKKAKQIEPQKTPQSQPQSQPNIKNQQQAKTQQKLIEFQPPEFEIARVEPDGSALIAGIGEAQSLVSIFANGKALASVPVDEDKSWLYVTRNPLNDGNKGPVTLTISGTSKDGKQHKWSNQVLTVFVEGQTKTKPIVIVQKPNEPTRIIQKPQQHNLTKINIDTLDYIENQSLIAITGTAPPLMKMRMYLNNKFQTDLKADKNGYFEKQKKIQPIENGKHIIRIDGIDQKGKVIQRIEVSFIKKIDENIHVNIIKGDNLWNIARKLYGDGFKYTVIYKANKHSIKDPDLIYPGQIFVVPRNLE